MGATDVALPEAPALILRLPSPATFPLKVVVMVVVVGFRGDTSDEGEDGECPAAFATRGALVEAGK